MNRQDFLKGMVALMAVPFLPKIEEKEQKVFQNYTQVFKESYRVNGETMEFSHNGQKYIYHKGMADTEERFVIDQELQMFKTFRIR